MRKRRVVCAGVGLLILAMLFLASALGGDNKSALDIAYEGLVADRVIPSGTPRTGQMTRREGIVYMYNLSQSIPRQIALPQMYQPDLSNYATKAQMTELKTLVDELRNEVAAQGVEIESLKRQLSSRPPGG